MHKNYMKKMRDIVKDKQDNHSLGWEDLLNVNSPKVNMQVMGSRTLTYIASGKKRFPIICVKQSYNVC